jgi:putative two-component system response regulator
MNSAPLLLLVDDTPENLDVLVGILRRDYRLRVASTGVAALERARQEPLPDLILLDLMMPDISGFEVCEQLKKDPRTRDIPIVFVTASGEVSHEARGFEVGGVDYVTKPFSPAVVEARIRTHLQLEMQRRQLLSQKEELRRLNNNLEHIVLERTSELEKRSEELHDSRLEIIRRLGKAAEYRDDDTGLHILRMSHYSRLLARASGESEDFAELVLHAAPMHDIGKIGISDSVLLKPGKLDDLEWNQMKKHPEIGSEIIGNQKVDFLQAASVVAISHHEKWNGMGYPYGLAGDKIPLIARIVAVADVFDALTSRRPYKEPWSVERAKDFLEEQSGIHFDPRLVSTFMEAWPEVLQIRNAYQDPDHHEP